MAGTATVQHGAFGRSPITAHDVYLFREGRHHRLYDKLGAHPAQSPKGGAGVHFALWAPNARSVSVIGDFNGWRADAHPLAARPDGSGIWEGFVAGVQRGARYKYRLVARHGDYAVEKADPFAQQAELAPHTASIVCAPAHTWRDAAWVSGRGVHNAAGAPDAVDEGHLCSWRRAPQEGNRHLSYRELAQQLPDYVREMGYTHVELMPITEHPFYGSWGYQTTGYFAATSRYGPPEDFQYLIDCLHQAGIGVILDWVPSHFPTDQHGLGYFDGTFLFEHADPKQGFHPEWSSSIFNYGRNEVRSILISSALYWLDRFHIDALRVDAVASMLYLDYARGPGEWVPNAHGGRENLEAIRFLRELNEAVYRDHPDTQTIAEESTSWPMVSRPTWLGGLGFGMKWNMGWMHDTLDYFALDPVHRRFHHDRLTFGIWYAWSENFVLPFSHDEVVYGKGSLLRRMPGDDWQRFANLRLLLAYQTLHPGKKLMFMGCEFGQWNEWNHEASLDWHLLEQPAHRGVQHLVRDLNHLYRDTPALHRHDFGAQGFQWVDVHDADHSVLSFLRKGDTPDDVVLAVCNFTPVPRHGFRFGVPCPGFWHELLNSDAGVYGGSGVGNLGGKQADPIPMHGHQWSVALTLPPLAAVCLRPGQA